MAGCSPLGFRSSLDSLITGRSANDSEQSSTPTIVTSNEREEEEEEYVAKNANAIIDAQRLSLRPIKARRYRISVLYSDDERPTVSPKRKATKAHRTQAAVSE